VADQGTRCRDALRRLYEQGRIASPWLAGMLAVESGGWRWRARLGEHDMLRGEGEPRGYCGGFESTANHMGWCPDPTDPATQGCLLALVREAADDVVWLAYDCGAWVVCGLPEDPGGSATEAEALTAALEALAGGGGE
jgi:hypothetical protein